MSENQTEKKSLNEQVKDAFEKTMNFLEPLTQKVRDLVLTFGELIVTVIVIVGVVSGVIDGLSTMSTVGFFAGISAIFSNIVSVITGALMIFLLFAIYKNTEK